MRKRILLAILLVIVLMLVTGCLSQADLDEAYEKGYLAGYDDGLAEGLEIGYDDGGYIGYNERIEHEKVFAEYLFAEELIKFLNEYCEDPVEYMVDTYAYYWGDFTKVYGDICFGTIPEEHRHLIHYPYFEESRLYHVTTGKGECFHTIPDCYSLLRTPRGEIKSMSLSEAEELGLKPCSKCVDLEKAYER